ncbi:MAG TPA: M13 family metallopeptidase [Terriglobales bacterium]|nr:M13 family metallopeptidase [Terriglobales bacterium]
MKNRLRFGHAPFAFLLLCISSALYSQTGPVELPLPYTPSLDPTVMDRSVDPCVDFYKYVCGKWSQKNPIPADRSAWSVYAKAYEDNLTLLRSILEQAANTSQRDAVTQKVGDFYSACMDEATANKRGLSAIRPELDAVSSIQSLTDLAAVVAHLQIVSTGSSMLFGSGSEQDPDDTEKQIASLDQGGIGLPDRDYYTQVDAKSKEIREHYLQHVQKVFEMLGEPPNTAKQNAQVVMQIETRLGKASWTAVERRDPYNLKHKMNLQGLEKLAPNFDWQLFFEKVESPKFETVDVSTPQFFQELSRMLKSESLQNWKNYLRFHLVNSYSPYLSEKFAQENFAFYNQYLRGAKQIRTRWKRCVQYSDAYLGEAVGQEYVRRVFSPELKQSTLDMVQRIEHQMELRIEHLDWMSPETKEQALIKLHSIRNKIGYPDNWRDYSSVAIAPDDFAGNVRNTTAFDSHRDFNKIGQPVDHNEWDMTPPTVDAEYNPQLNDINFPAGVLLPPMYDAKMDDAPNYGNTGATIGHELTHAFDDQGRQFDAKGNLRDWWTKQDAAKFKDRAQCVSNQYAKYVVVDNIHIKSELTLGEDVADLGGTILAYLAWKDATKDKHLESVDGLTPDQRYFVGFGQWDCGEVRPQQARDWAITNPHSPAEYRINGVLVNISEFAEAFSCKAGQPMVKAKEKVCKVW